jgi:hypothetical protein
MGWLLLPVVLWVLFIQFRYMARQFRSVSWPVVNATIQKGPIGFVPIGKEEGTPACPDHAYGGVIPFHYLL